MNQSSIDVAIFTSVTKKTLEGAQARELCQRIADTCKSLNDALLATLAQGGEFSSIQRAYTTVVNAHTTLRQQLTNKLNQKVKGEPLATEYGQSVVQAKLGYEEYMEIDSTPEAVVLDLRKVALACGSCHAAALALLDELPTSPPGKAAGPKKSANNASMILQEGEVAFEPIDLDALE